MNSIGEGSQLLRIHSHRENNSKLCCANKVNIFHRLTRKQTLTSQAEADPLGGRLGSISAICFSSSGILGQPETIMHSVNYTEEYDRQCRFI